MSYELITLLMFSSLMVMLLIGQRVFGAIGLWLPPRLFSCGVMVRLKCLSTPAFRC